MKQNYYIAQQDTNGIRRYLNKEGTFTRELRNRGFTVMFNDIVPALALAVEIDALVLLGTVNGFVLI
jgi:hypothetical protein